MGDRISRELGRTRSTCSLRRCLKRVREVSSHGVGLVPEEVTFPKGKDSYPLTQLGSGRGMFSVWTECKSGLKVGVKSKEGKVQKTVLIDISY